MAGAGEDAGGAGSLALVQEYGWSDSDSGSGEEGGGGAHREPLELSDMVLKNNIINACAHAPPVAGGPVSAGPEAGTPREIEEHRMLIDPASAGVIEYSVSEYRSAEGEPEESRSDDSDDSVSSDDSSYVNSVKDAEDISTSGEEESLERGAGDAVEPDGDGETEGAPWQAPRVRGELGLDELPPIESLSISVPASQCAPIGKVFNIVDKLVIVQALPETPAVDLDSVLFLESGARALGKVFDVFGPVTEPYYCVRFNSAEHARQAGVQRGHQVYIAPQTDHTHYVFLTQLMKMKGSDASWKNDVEPPASLLEYSDDEEERRVARSRREQRRNTESPAAADGARAARPKPTRFEEQMNRKNLQRTAEANNRFGDANPFARVPRTPCPPAGRGQEQGRPWGAARGRADRQALCGDGGRGRGPPPLMCLEGGWGQGAPPLVREEGRDRAYGALTGVPFPHAPPHHAFNAAPPIVNVPFNPIFHSRMPPPFRTGNVNRPYRTARGPRGWGAPPYDHAAPSPRPPRPGDWFTSSLPPPPPPGT